MDELNLREKRLAMAIARARELEDRLEELRAAVQESVTAHEEGRPADGIFAALRRTLEVVPAGRWDQEACIEKAHDWDDRYGEPPKAVDWNVSQLRARSRDPEVVNRYQSGEWPSQRTVVRLFGNWTSFMFQAGFQPRMGPEDTSGQGEHDENGLPEWTGWQYLPYHRKLAGLSQNALAKSIGIHNEYVSQIERGVKTNPRIRVVLALAIGLRVNPRALMEFEPVSEDEHTP